jgi:Raf kinase inhibitor-like YbhB/YbcL family protein
MALSLTSPAFQNGGEIPSTHTCEGKDVSPPLAWSGTPPGTRSLALIVDDPDAPDPKAPKMTWVHWVIYNLPPDTRRLPQDVPNRQTLPSGAVQGVNGAGTVGYMGPCPPSGTHRYVFRVYALDTQLDLGGSATKEDLVSAMEGHVLAEGHLMGTYRRH